MAYYTLNELLEEVNKIAQLPSTENLRSSVTKQLVHVYRRIGAESLFHPGLLLVAPTPYQYVDLPDQCLKLIDVRCGYDHRLTGDGIIRDVNRFGRFVGGYAFTRYTEQERRIWFSDGRLNEPLSITYWSVPVNPAGVPMIDDRIWQAALLYCQGEAARMNLHNRNKQSFSGLPMQVDQQLANREMDAARADCNEPAAPDFAKLYEALAIQNENNIIRIGY